MNANHFVTANGGRMICESCLRQKYSKENKAGVFKGIYEFTNKISEEFKNFSYMIRGIAEMATVHPIEPLRNSVRAEVLEKKGATEKIFGLAKEYKILVQTYIEAWD